MSFFFFFGSVFSDVVFECTVTASKNLQKCTDGVLKPVEGNEFGML